VGPPPEQERVGALVGLVHERRGFVVEVRPSAALESAALVLLPPAGPLHDSVDGDLRRGRQFHGRGSLLAGSVVVGIRPDRGAELIGRSRVRPADPFRTLPNTARVGDGVLLNLAASMADGILEGLVPEKIWVDVSTS